MVLFISVVLLVFGFGSSERLAGAYGVAVCGTLAADSLLFWWCLEESSKSLGRLWRLPF